MDISEELNQIIIAAYREAESRSHEYLTPEHVLYAALFFERGREIISQCGGDIEAIGRELGVDSIGYLSIEDLLDAAPHENGEAYCTACFSGVYPIPVDAKYTKDEHEA